MVKSRAGWILGPFIGAVGCAIPNPLFILPDEDTLAGSSDALTTTTTSDTSASTEPSMTITAGSETGVGSSGASAQCGDGVVEDGEQCDDGNDIPGDGCESNCKPLFPKDPALVPDTAGALAIAIADIDADGDNDLLLAYPDCPGPCVRRYINSGPAIFTKDGGDILTATPVDHLVTGDWDAEPGVDFAYASGGFAYVYFQSGMGLPAFQLLGDPRSLVAADIDGDGPLDLLLVDDLNGHLNYALAANGTFGPQITVSEVSGPRRAAVADVDNDGTADFIFSAEGGNGVGLFLDLKHDGAPTGPFFTEATTATALAIGNFAIEAGHTPNAVFYGQVETGGSLQVYVNKGAGQYEKFKNNVAAKNDVMELLAPRLNSATDDNIIALSPLSIQVFTLVEGDFKAGPSLSLGEELRDIAAGDLNGDGRTDLAVVGKNQCFILINQSP